MAIDFFCALNFFENLSSKNTTR